MRPPESYIQLHGALFEHVQRSGLFPDSKTFVDAIPRQEPAVIEASYKEQSGGEDFDLEQFIRAHFALPGLDEGGEQRAESPAPREADMEAHVEALWEELERSPDANVDPESTLIPLPHPYIVPGGRFREIYYWDTYFTAEGLAASGRLDIVENLARNFAHLVETVGHVPNGNRVYYASRSQPPFFAVLVDLLVRHRGPDAAQPFLPALEKEHAFWMDGAFNGVQAQRRTIEVDNDITLNRYWDDRPLPRAESWREDCALARQSGREPGGLYRDLRAACESGWDFSSRWLSDPKRLDSIRTTELLPVDLNALLWFMETRLSEWCEGEKAAKYRSDANRRKSVFNYYFWNEHLGFYFDYDWKNERNPMQWTLAAVYPLFFEMASQKQAKSVAEHLSDRFLCEGGLATTILKTGQQWDRPNGWAPLQWMAVKGLKNYRYNDLAREITGRWLQLNEKVYRNTGKMMEKYNVCDLGLEAGGGEYPLQDGFGWTNGVALALRRLWE